MACVDSTSDVRTECIGEAVLDLCLDRVCLLGSSLWGSVAPVFVIFSVWEQTFCVDGRVLN
eukprot:116526-Pelagomonas_calceolata.AAC.1